MPYYFFINRTLKEICSFDKNSPVLTQLESAVRSSKNWNIRQQIIVEADRELVYHLVDDLGYVLLG
jgi:hypothetical protein